MSAPDGLRYRVKRSCYFNRDWLGPRRWRDVVGPCYGTAECTADVCFWLISKPLDGECTNNTVEEVPEFFIGSPGVGLKGLLSSFF